MESISTLPSTCDNPKKNFKKRNIENCNSTKIGGSVDLNICMDGENDPNQFISNEHDNVALNHDSGDNQSDIHFDSTAKMLAPQQLHYTLLSNLIKLNLKLYQDNYRLKIFCNNFKNYLEKNIDKKCNNEDERKQALETSSKFTQGYSNVQVQLFDDSRSMKQLIDSLNTRNKDDLNLESMENIDKKLFASSHTLLGNLENDTTQEKNLIDGLLKNFAKSNKSIAAGKFKSAKESAESLHQNYSKPSFTRHKSSSSSFALKPVNDTEAIALRRSTRHRSIIDDAPKDRFFTCRFCATSFDQVDLLSDHLEHRHNSLFQCSDCDRIFVSSTEFSLHFPCGTNSFSCSDPIGITETNDPMPTNSTPIHSSTLNSVKPFCSTPRKGKSPVSAKEKRRSKKLAASNSSSQSSAKFPCSQCSLSFKRATYLSNHMKGVHATSLPSSEPSIAANEADLDASADDSNTSYYCCDCNKSFNRSIFLVDHIKACHTENVCVGCKKQFKVRSCLNRHIKESNCVTQIPQRSYSCKFCDFPFKRITHLNQHILRKHSNAPSLELVIESYHEGESTPIESSNRGGKNNAVSATSTDAAYSRNYSNEVTNLKEERLEVTLEAPLSPPPLHCSKCNISFGGNAALVSHLSEQHLDCDGAFQCLDCPKRFLSRNTIMRHLRQSNCFRPHSAFAETPNPHLDEDYRALSPLNRIDDDDDEQTEEDNDEEIESILEENREMQIANDESKNRNCTSSCSARPLSSDSTSIQQHVALSQETDCQKFSCDWPACDFVAINSQLVDDHQRSVHLAFDALTSTYRCTKCRLSFSDEAECSKHWRAVHFAAPYRCSYGNGACKFTSTSLRVLREHKSSAHVKIKCFTCDWPNCGKTFVNRSLVKHHIRISHKNERLHPCVWPGCELSFKRPINLKHHMATHTGVCDYRCTIEGCGMSFRNPGSLYLHRRRHEQNKIKNENAGYGAGSNPDQSGSERRKPRIGRPPKQIATTTTTTTCAEGSDKLQSQQLAAQIKLEASSLDIERSKVQQMAHVSTSTSPLYMMHTHTTANLPTSSYPSEQCATNMDNSFASTMERMSTATNATTQSTATTTTMDTFAADTLHTSPPLNGGAIVMNPHFARRSSPNLVVASPSMQQPQQHLHSSSLSSVAQSATGQVVGLASSAPQQTIQIIYLPSAVSTISSPQTTATAHAQITSINGQTYMQTL